MKSGWLLFCGGLILGLAAGLLLRPGDNPSAAETNGGAGSTIGGSRSLAPSGTPSKRTRTPGSRSLRTGSPRGGAGGGQADFLSYLESLSQVDDETELNLMELTRQAAALTYLSESAALALLATLNEPPKEGEDDDREELRKVAAVLVFSRLCELNGPEAMRMVADGEMGEDWEHDTEELLAMGMNAWVAVDPKGAQQWFEGQLAEADKMAAAGYEDDDIEGVVGLLKEDDLRIAYLNGMAKLDPEGLERRMSEFESDEVRDAMTDEVMEALVRHEDSKQGLIALLERSGKESFNARQEALEKLGKKDPLAAAKWVDGQPSSSHKDHHIAGVAQALMKRDLDAGVDWYMDQDLHDENRTGDRASRIVNVMARKSYDKAAGWLANQPDGSHRDQGEASLANIAASRKNWDEAVAWAAAIEDHGTRKSTLTNVFRRGYDHHQKSLTPDLLQAAEAAGFGEDARTYGNK